jgi:ABC-type glycerol-3-phosphate transport system substrate-binding protein
MRKKSILCLVIIMLVSQLALSCSGQDQNQKKYTLVIWKPFETPDTMQPIIDAYRKAHPTVDIIYVQKDIATYESDLLNAFASGAGPDIFSIHNDWLARYKDKMFPAPAGLFPLRAFEDTFVEVARQDLYDESDNLYAVPMAMDVLALYYNRDLLGSVGIAQPPQTWEEVISAVKKLTQQDKYGNFTTNGIALGTSGNINRSTDILSLLMLQNGTQIYNSTHNGVAINKEMTSPTGERYNPGTQALEFYTQFANPAKETYTWNVRNNQSIDAFASGQAAMILSYSYLVPTLETKAPLLNYGIAPVPQIDLSKPKVNYANYFAEAVSKFSPNAAAAWDFLKYAISKEALTLFYAKHKQAAPRKDIISEQLSDPEIGVFAEGALTAKTFYKPDASRVEAIFATMIDDVILRGKSAQQALSTAAQLLGDLLR